MDKALYAVVMEAYTGISTRKVDALVEALAGASGISKSEVSRICQGHRLTGKAFLGRPLDHARYPYVFLDATYLHGRLGQNMQVVSRAVVVAIGNRYAEAQWLQMTSTARCSASPWVTARRRASGGSSSAPSNRRLLRSSRSVALLEPGW